MSLDNDFQAVAAQANDRVDFNKLEKKSSLSGED